MLLLVAALVGPIPLRGVQEALVPVGNETTQVAVGSLVSAEKKATVLDLLPGDVQVPCTAVALNHSALLHYMCHGRNSVQPVFPGSKAHVNQTHLRVILQHQP